MPAEPVALTPSLTRFFAGVLNLVAVGVGHTVVYLIYIYFCNLFTLLYCTRTSFSYARVAQHSAMIATFRNPELLATVHGIGWMNG